MSRRPFHLLALSQVLSLTSTRLSTIAIPWLVLTISGDPVLTGLVAMAEMLPYVFAKALGGPMIDRLGPVRISVVCDVLSAVVIALVPLFHTLGVLSIPLLLPTVFVLGLLRGPADAAKHALVPDVAQEAGFPLERVTGVMGAIERLASTVGAAGAGALIALIGSVEALWLNMAGFALAGMVLALGPRRVVQAAPAATASYLGELQEGWRFLRRDAVLVSIVLMVAVTNLFDQAYAVVLLPVWAQTGGFGADLLGLLLAVFSAASIGGAVIAAAIGERLPRLPVYVIAFVLTGFPRFAIFAVEAPMLAVFATLAIAGFASGFLNPILSAVMYERTPRPLMGRVMSLITAFCWALMPFGGVAGGALIALTGLPAAFATMGVAYLGATLSPLVGRSFRAMARPS